MIRATSGFVVGISVTPVASGAAVTVVGSVVSPMGLTAQPASNSSARRIGMIRFIRIDLSVIQDENSITAVAEMLLKIGSSSRENSQFCYESRNCCIIRILTKY